MRRPWLRPPSRAGALAGLTVLAVVLFAAAATGLAVLPGYHVMGRTLAGVRWPWVAASLGGVVVAGGGYLLAWRGITRGGDGPRLGGRQWVAVVLAGFGGFVARGGSAIDRYAMLAGGAGRRDADVRIAGLDALEHVPLAVGCCAAAIYLLATGQTDPPPLDFVWPWAVAPPVGAALAVLAVARYRERLRDARGLLRYVGIGLDGVGLLWTTAKNRRTGPLALAGMTVFWAAEIFALWSGLAAFGTRLGLAQVILADAIGYVLTRRAAPLGGAGVIDICLVMCVWACGAPLAVAIAGTFTYRFFSLFAVLPFSFAALPALRGIGGEGNTPSREPAVQPAPRESLPGQAAG
jgi:hypothetical protein